MVKKEITDFLKRTPPFDLLTDEQRDRTAGAVSVEYYPRGIKIFSQGGPPCEALRLVKKGGVKVYLVGPDDREMVLDFRSEGDSFGFVSLLSGDRSRANILAVEDTVCYLIPRQTVLELMTEQPLLRDYFMKSFFINFIDKTAGGLGRRDPVFETGDRLLYATPVRELVSREVVTGEPGMSVREAAGVMSMNRVSSIILTDADGVPAGILTDRDLRDKVVARGLSPDTRAEEIMSPPLIRVDGTEPAFEALMRMISYNIHHLLVVESGRLLGVVTNHDFMLLQGTSPLSIVKNISKQKTLDGLEPVGRGIDRITMRLVKQGVSARHVVRIISELDDSLLQKIIELLVEELGRPPTAFAFLLFGSRGRKEQTYKASLDCAVVLADPATRAEDEKARAYFRRFSERFDEALERCGCPRINRDRFGGATPIFHTSQEWREIVTRAIASGAEQAVIDGSKFLDGRHLFGDASLSAGLLEALHDEVRARRELYEELAAVAALNRSPIGFFKQFVVEKGGEHKDEFDLKERGVRPIVDGVRALALRSGVRATSTLERLEALLRDGALTEEMRKDLVSAYDFLMQLRLEDQIVKRESMDVVDDFIAPAALSHLQRRTLKEAFEIIARLQERVALIFRREVSI